MAGHLPAQLLGHLGRERRDARCPRCGEDERDRTSNSAANRPGRLASNTMRSPRRAASRTLCVTNTTVRPGLPPHALELVVEHVAGDRVERAERLVHQQHVGVLRERARRARRAGACRPRARAVACPRTRRGGRGRGARGPGPARGRRPTPRSRSASSTLPAAVSHGKSADSWNMSAVRPVTSIVAARGLVEPGDQVEQRRLAAPRGARRCR